MEKEGLRHLLDIPAETQSRQWIEGLEFRKEARARGTNLHIISIQMVFKGIRLDNFNKEITVEKWPTSVVIPRKVQIYGLEKIKRNQKRRLRSSQSKRDTLGDCAVLENKINKEEGNNTFLNKMVTENWSLVI